MKIAVASGKGGTGKTFVATNLLHVLLKNQNKAVLADCDAEVPNAVSFFRATLVKSREVNQMVPVIDTALCTFCGRCHEYCSYHAIFLIPSLQIIQVTDSLCHGCGACLVACQYGAITEKAVSVGQVTTFAVDGIPVLIEARMNDGGMTPVPIIKAALKETETEDTTYILDSPPGTSCPFITTTAASDFVILVTEPTPFGLSDLKQSVETLKLLKKPFGVIINRAGLGNDGVKRYLDQENIQLLMEIPFDKEIARTCTRGDLVSATNQKLADNLYQMFIKIIHAHGDRGNQR
jgi:MinD superfamily P-loop ATPase